MNPEIMKPVPEPKPGPADLDPEDEQAAEVRQILDKLIPRNRQGALVDVGATISIGGGEFRVASFGSNALHLECLPGTSIFTIKSRRSRVGMIKKPKPGDVRE